jgi:hypothetical protein
VLPISSAEELAKVPVEGTSLVLGDVATVVEDHPLLIGDALVEDSPNILLVIEKLPGINTLEVTRGRPNAAPASCSPLDATSSAGELSRNGAHQPPRTLVIAVLDCPVYRIFLWLANCGVSFMAIVVYIRGSVRALRAVKH